LCLFLADFERAFYVEQYRLLMRGRSRYAIDHQEDARFRARALYQSYGIFKVRPDWLEIGLGPSRAWAERTEIVARDEILYYEDKESGLRLPMHEATLPWGDSGPAPSSSSVSDLWDVSEQIRTEDQVDARLPLLNAEELLADGSFDLVRQIVADYGQNYFISTILGTPFSDAYGLLGFQGLMVIQHDRPDLFHYLLQRRLVQMQAIQEAWAKVGIHGVYVEETFTGADMISPRSYDEFVFAYNQPFFRHMSAQGLLPIHYVCGDVIPRLHRIRELDITAVAVEESKKNFVIEIESVVEEVGDRLAVFGNVDAVRFGLHATQEEMAREVKRQARFGARARGFVVSTGSPLPLDSNPRQVDAMVTRAHALRISGFPG
jgi:uroporphyrinogen-III decarboxylase